MGDTGFVTDDFVYAYDPIGNRRAATETCFSAVPPVIAERRYFGDTSEAAEAAGGDELNQYRRIDTPGGDLDPACDADGNLTDDGTNTYTWDAENRLTKVTRKSDGKLLAEYRYDYMGRRVWKETTADAPQGATERIFIYHGWALIGEYDASSPGKIASTTTPRRTYTWGLDLSGTLQGAGGIGGLLAIEEHSGTHSGIHYPAYDANGNVAGVLDDATGAKEAAYVYDPFGNPASASIYSLSPGPYAAENPFRFSTKYRDEETGWLYYGYRYYDPAEGRWPSRDPIGEEGGLNLYGFVGNDGVGLVDYLGLSSTRPSDTIRWPRMPAPDAPRAEWDEFIERSQKAFDEAVDEATASGTARKRAKERFARMLARADRDRLVRELRYEHLRRINSAFKGTGRSVCRSSNISLILNITKGGLSAGMTYLCKKQETACKNCVIAVDNPELILEKCERICAKADELCDLAADLALDIVSQEFE